MRLSQPAATALPLLSILSCVLLAGAWLGSGAALAQSRDGSDPFDEELPEFQPGLIATYRSGGAQAVRVDEDVLFDWQFESVDARLPPEQPFQVQWSGYLQARDNGDFQLSVYAAGSVQITLSGEKIMDFQSALPTWHHSKPIALRFGRHPIEVRYNSVEESSDRRMGLYWSGPSFPLEPIAPRYLLHETEDRPESQFEYGQLLSRGLRCLACHEPPGGNSSSRQLLRAPSLTRVRDNLRPQWLVEHLSEQVSAGGMQLNSRRMPFFALDPASAQTIASALFDASEQAAAPEDIPEELRALARQRRRREPEVRTQADAGQGALLFASVGCLSCHQVEQLGEPVGTAGQIFSGGDLSQIAAKRTRDFFARWLQDPAMVNKDHRMPIFELSMIERLDLQEYLMQLGDADSAGLKDEVWENVDQAEAADLIQKHRCGACHELPERFAVELQTIPLTANSDWDEGCLTAADAGRRVPGFGLNASQRNALRTFFAEEQPAPGPVDGHQLMVENNCLSCHSRDLAEGNTPQLASIAKHIPETAARLAALSPPALTGVGDKLTERALKESIQRTGSPLRSWLDVRMPKFRFTPQQLSAVVQYLIGHDRIPEGFPLESMQAGTDRLASMSSQAAELAAGRLVTAEGFGCQSCHQIGEFEPPAVDLKARGTNLEMIGNRLRESWFHRWVRNPARIVPRMEMPAIQTAAKGVLEDDLDLQLAALWRILNKPGYRPPRPNPTRIVRAHNLPELDEAAKLVTCVIETPDKIFLRPLAIGLPNRHNLLFDLQTASLAGWWIGDTAAQYTRGKSWYWELGNPLLNSSQQQVGASSDGPLLERIELIDSANRRWQAVPQGQLATALDKMSHIDGGIVWRGRILMASGDLTREIPIEQKIVAQTNAAVVETVVSLEDGDRVRLITAANPLVADDGVQIPISRESHALLSSSQSLISLEAGEICIDRVDSSAPAASWQSVYRTDVPPDSFPMLPPVQNSLQPRALQCVPGYEVVQLPLPRDEMPISLAWGPDGSFFAGSLKGRVLRLHDDDGDSLHERYELISDEFPTPYGLHVNSDGTVDALAKFALLRLSPPEAGPGAIWNAQVIADGWGYTADYHDWAVGLERDAQGNYLMALPCQQDDRSPAAAHLRGHALKLIPNPDSAERHRAYRIESISAGLRFPMGLALNSEGDLFATDNQGNYNPFNELNHLRPGKRYGFINKLENKDGFSPPFESPAINLPHPWSRSVNGICFLNTPSALKEQGVSSHFGPFEGHLVGCEMNGRSLVRMSLQRVGDTYQGAAYVFSVPNLDPQETFEGPIVCKVSPNGDLYVGNLQDSGWGGGQNTGSIARLRPTGPLPVGIAEVRATSRGLVIDFTQEVDRRKAEDAASYQIRSYRRVSTPAYGGEDQDERTERPTSIHVTPDRKRVELEFQTLREGCVYELNIADIGPAGEALFPSEAHYNLRTIPR